MSKLKISIGCDPELFLRNPSTHDFVTARDLIPGDKYSPFPVDHGAVQVDGVAAEFNTDPAYTADEFVNNVFHVVDTLKGMVPGYELVAEPVANFKPDYFATLDEQSKELGCEPDFNAWTGVANPRPDGERPFRTGSGHIHIGFGEFDAYSDEHHHTCCEMAKQLDYYLGVPSLSWDADNTRRALYGMAGAFRPKSYGLEYRVLSNSWVGRRLLMRWIYQQAVRAVTDWHAGKIAAEIHGDQARVIIDKNVVDWKYFHDFNDFNFNPPERVLNEKRAA